MAGQRIFLFHGMNANFRNTFIENESKSTFIYPKEDGRGGDVVLDPRTAKCRVSINGKLKRRITHFSNNLSKVGRSAYFARRLYAALCS